MPFKDKQKALQYARAWRQAHPEITAAKLAWAKLNPDKVRESKRRSCEKHREANAARRREYRRLNRERLDAQKRQWERDNPDRVAASRALQRIRKATVQLATHLRYHYSVTIDDYLSLLAAQGGGCAICGVQRNNYGRSPRLNLDHDHSTGRVRGLLCSKCNSALGYLGDDPRRLRRAAAYIEGWNGKTANHGGTSGFQPVLAIVPEAQSEAGGDQGVVATGTFD